MLEELASTEASGPCDFRAGRRLKSLPELGTDVHDYRPTCRASVKLMALTLEGWSGMENFVNNSP